MDVRKCTGNKNTFILAQTYRSLYHKGGMGKPIGQETVQVYESPNHDISIPSLMIGGPSNQIKCGNASTFFAISTF